MRNIEVDDEVFKGLQSLAEPLVDTPNDVIRRLLDLNAAPRPTSGTSRAKGTAAESRTPPVGRGRSRSKAAREVFPDSVRTRAPRGSLLPESEYEIPLLAAIDRQGGQAGHKEVVAAVGEALGSRFKPLDLEAYPGSGEVRWENRVKFVRLRLIERGLMAREAPRGQWVITEAGRNLLMERGVLR